MPVPPSELGLSRREFLIAAATAIPAAACYSPGLNQLKGDQDGSRSLAQGVAENIAQAAAPRERDISKLVPRVVWRGEFMAHRDYLEDLLWRGDFSFGGEVKPGVIAAIDITTGVPIWNKDGVQRNLGINHAKGLLYFLIDGKFTALEEKTGEVRWAEPLPGLNMQYVEGRYGDYGVFTFRNDQGNFLRAFDQRNGKPTFDRPIKAPRYSAHKADSRNIGILKEEDEKGNLMRISAIDLVTGQERTRAIEPGWRIYLPMTQKTIFLENRERKLATGVSVDSLEPVWIKENVDVSQCSFGYVVVEDLARHVFKIVDEQGRVSDWEMPAKNTHIWISEPPLENEAAKFWFWQDYGSPHVQLIEMGSGKVKWESREFQADSDLIEFAGGIGVLRGRIDGKRGQIIAIDMASGQIKWVKATGEVDSLAHDFGMVTYTTDGIKHYLNPQNGELIGELDIGLKFYGGAGLRFGFYEKIDQANSVRQVVVTGV